MTDLISRQSAIEAIEFGITYLKILNTETGEVTEPFAKINDELREAVNRVKELPSAQPMNDSLHRQDVLDEIENWAECGEDKFENAVKALFDRIENMPSEQRTGYWSVESADRNTGYGGAIVCSECGCDGGSTYWKYCPYCGARMDEE